MRPRPRRVAVLGGNRIPFARSNGAYAHASNQDMLTAALDGLVDALRARGRAARRGRRRRGAQAQPRLQPHARVACSARASRPRRRPTTSSRRAAPGSRPRSWSPTRSRSARSTSGIAGGVDTASDAPIAVNEDLRQILLDAQPREVAPGARAGAARLRPQQLVPAIPRNARAAHRPVDGRAHGAQAARVGRSRARRRTSSPSRQPPATSPPPTSAASSTTSSRRTSGSSATRTCAPTRRVEKLAKLKPVFGGDDGTMTAGNSTPLSDGASAVLLASEEWAAERGLPVLALLRRRRDRGGRLRARREGLLMAPAYAVPRLLERNGLTLQDFDLYEIHEAFASQVLCDAEGVGGPGLLPRAARLDAPLGAIDRAKLNVNGGSLAAGHPFAATGGRIVAVARQGAARARRRPRPDQRSAPPAARASSRSWRSAA